MVAVKSQTPFVFLALVVLAALLPLLSAEPAAAADELNCLLCHKYRGLSRIAEDGKFRLFYINENLFESGPHAKVKCNDCHRDINEIPHEPARPVNCTVECHIVEPSGQRRFSHQPIEDILLKGVHGKYDENGKLKKYAEDYPGCKDCHEEPLYRPLSFFKGKSYGVSERAIGRCKTCHRTGKFAEIFYTHVTSRLQKTRSPREIVEICAKCHGDEKFRRRHKLDDVVTSYKETFHYKAIRHGSEHTPDCVDCHVVYGENVHLIEGQISPTSAVNEANVARTCRTEDCHPRAGENLAGYQVHVTYDPEKYPLQYWMLVFFKALMAGVMYFFLVFIFLELLRRLFPRAALFKEAGHGDGDGGPGGAGRG
ncbi:MAG TPA: cytochrome C [Deltaproteobacteria bacterium]|nr:cytochrome C [Deltaproteobacteria bacterium]